MVATATQPDSRLQVVQQGVLVSADEWTDRRVEFIRQNLCNGAPDAEAEAFIHICKRRGLAPEEKQIYLIPRKGGWTIQTSIDGYRLIAERSKLYAGSDEPIFVEAPDKLNNGRRYPLKATVTVWKIVSGVRCPFTASAVWDEYNAGQNLWLTLPHVMLAKCAEAQALRKAFPADLSGIYTVDEMAQADAPIVNSRPSNGAPATNGNGGAPRDWSEFWARCKAEFGVDPKKYGELVGKMAPQVEGGIPGAWAAIASINGKPSAPAPGSVTVVNDGEHVDVATGEIVEPPPANSNRFARLHAIGAERGLDHNALHRIAILKRGMSFGGTNFTDTMLSDFEATIETASDEDILLWAMDWDAEIAAAEPQGEQALLDLGQRMKLAGVNKESHQGLAQAFAAAIKRAREQPQEGLIRDLPPTPTGDVGDDRYTS